MEHKNNEIIKPVEAAPSLLHSVDILQLRKRLNVKSSSEVVKSGNKALVIDAAHNISNSSPLMRSDDPNTDLNHTASHEKKLYSSTNSQQGSHSNTGSLSFVSSIRFSRNSTNHDSSNLSTPNAVSPEFNSKYPSPTSIFHPTFLRHVKMDNTSSNSINSEKSIDHTIQPVSTTTTDDSRTAANTDPSLTGGPSYSSKGGLFSTFQNSFILNRSRSKSLKPATFSTEDENHKVPASPSTNILNSSTQASSTLAPTTTSKPSKRSSLLSIGDSFRSTVSASFYNFSTSFSHRQMHNTATESTINNTSNNTNNTTATTTSTGNKTTAYLRSILNSKPTTTNPEETNKTNTGTTTVTFGVDTTSSNTINRDHPSVDSDSYQWNLGNDVIQVDTPIGHNHTYYDDNDDDSDDEENEKNSTTNSNTGDVTNSQSNISPNPSPRKTHLFSRGIPHTDSIETNYSVTQPVLSPVPIKLSTKQTTLVEPRIIQYETNRKSDFFDAVNSPLYSSRSRLSSADDDYLNRMSIRSSIAESEFPIDGVSLYVFDELIELCGGMDALKGLTTTDVCEKFIKPMTLSTQCSYCHHLKRLDRKQSTSSSASRHGLSAPSSSSSLISSSSVGDTMNDTIQSLLLPSSKGLNHSTNTSNSTTVLNTNTLANSTSTSSRINMESTDVQISSKIPSQKSSQPSTHQSTRQRALSHRSEKPLPKKVKEATVFVSHAWQFQFLDVVDALKSHFEGSDEEVYVWFDLFSNNQHTAIKHDFIWWSTTFKNAIALFGHTVLILSPWDNPIPLRRAWCLFEIYATVETKSLLQIAMSKQEQTSFLQAIQTGYEVVNQMITSIDAERSEAGNPTDKDMIFEVIQCSIGFNEINALVCEQMRDWVIATTISAIKNEHSEETITRLRSTLGLLYYGQGRYSDAEKLFKQCISWMITNLGIKHDITLETYEHLGNVYQAQAKYTEAEKLYTQNLKIRTAKLGEDHEDTLTSLDHLAHVYYNEKKYDIALPLFLQCYETKRVKHGINYHPTLTAMNNLALLYFRMKRYDESEALYVECLQYMYTLLGSYHPDRLYCMNGLASLYSMKKEYTKAAPLFLECLEATITKLGHDHPNTLDSMNNLGIVYKNMKKYDLAENLLLKCFESRWNTLGKHHPDTLNTLELLSSVYEKTDKYDLAYSKVKLSYEIRKETLGGRHPDTLHAYIRLGTILEKLKKYTKAESIYIECLETCMHVLGQSHKDTLSIMNTLAIYYFNQQLYEHSISLYEKIYELKRDDVTDYGPTHPETLRILLNLGISYQKLEKTEIAIQYFKSCYYKNKETYGDQHADTKLTRKYLQAAIKYYKNKVELTAAATSASDHSINMGEGHYHSTENDDTKTTTVEDHLRHEDEYKAAGSAESEYIPQENTTTPILTSLDMSHLSCIPHNISDLNKQDSNSVITDSSSNKQEE